MLIVPIMALGHTWNWSPVWVATSTESEVIFTMRLSRNGTLPCQYGDEEMAYQDGGRRVDISF